MIKVDEKTLLPTEEIKPIPKLQMEFDIDFWNSLEIKLKPLQERFAQHIVQGKSATDAYFLATKECKGKELKRKTCTEKGSKMLKDNDVMTRIKSLHRAVTEQFVMSDIELHKHLSDIIRGPCKTSDKIAAMSLLAKIKGMLNPDVQIHQNQSFVNLQVEVVDGKAPTFKEETKKAIETEATED